MTAFSRFRIVMLFLAMVLPIAIVMACAGEPAGDDSDDNGNGNGGNGNSGGTGMVQCQPPQTNCNGTCTVVGSDPLNCSACGAACAFGQKCMAGSCTCDAPYVACGLSCINTQSDPMNCGVCGTVCPANLPYCSAGTCSATCTQTTCGTLCTDTMTDIRNCGTCGTTCVLGQGCAAGACACPAGQVLCNGACATTCGGGTGGTGAGGASATGGASTGGASGAGPTGGTGGMVVQKLCATKVVPATALITDFESYDGVKPAYGTGSWTFTMGPTTAPAYAGLYGLSESWNDATMMGPATYTLAMAAGQAGLYGVHAANTATTDWGGGIGMWMGCVNASTFTGISFYVRGSAPTMKGNFSLAMESATPPDAANPAGGGTCTPAPTDGCKSPGYEFPITVDWTLITIPWSMFTTGVGASGAVITPNGDLITGMSWGAGINYVPNPVDGGMPAYVPEPGMYSIDIDNLSFTQ